jgi:hypothetical protein
MYSEQGERVLRILKDRGPEGAPPQSLRVGSLSQEASALSLAVERCQQIGIFNAEEANSFLSSALSFDAKTMASVSVSVNVISALYEGWDIHLEQAQRFIDMFFGLEKDDVAKILARIIEDVVKVDRDLQLLLDTKKISVEQFNSVKEMPVAIDRVCALLELGY